MRNCYNDVLTKEENILRQWNEYYNKLMNQENIRESRWNGVKKASQRVKPISKEKDWTETQKMKNGKIVDLDHVRTSQIM